MEVRAYRTEQWSRIRTRDQPVTLTRHHSGHVAVTVDQVVRAPDVTIISRGRFLHLHRLQSGRFATMHLRPRSSRDAPRRAAEIVQTRNASLVELGDADSFAELGERKVHRLCRT